MAKISTHRCNGRLRDTCCAWPVMLYIFNVAALIGPIVFVNWNYCHLKDKGLCRQEKNDTGHSDYVTSTLTSTQKKKCEKYVQGIALHTKLASGVLHKIHIEINVHFMQDFLW